MLERAAPTAYFDLELTTLAGCTPAERVPLAPVTRLPEKFVQLEFFPEVRHVEAVDPREVIGPGTRVAALYRVREGESSRVHQVYHDRHGWYCEEHGPTCAAVFDATRAASAR